MLKVYVINLVNSVARREKTCARLNELDVEFKLFEAINGKELKHPLFDRYDDEIRECYRGTKLSGGELGCFASHFLLWQECIKLNEPIVVMEDDIEIHQNFRTALMRAELIVDQLQYIRLAGTILYRRPYKKIGVVDEFDLVDHIRGPSGTLCYVLHPAAAKLLTENAKCWYLAVDDYMDRYWGHGVDCYSLMPFVVSAVDNESDIIRNVKSDMPLVLKLRREWYRRLDRIRRTWYRCFVRSKLKGSRL